MAARILVVEDEPLIRQLICDLLEDAGHQVTRAGNVSEALQLARSFHPDLVLQDLHVPGGGGQMVLRELRTMEGFSDLPVIVVTAQAMTGDRERLIAMGFDGYFSKPIDIETFTEMVESYLGNVPTAPSEPATPRASLSPNPAQNAFSSVLPARAQALVGAVEYWLTSPSDASLRAEASMLAHALRGTAGSYGCSDIADAIERIEGSLGDMATEWTPDQSIALESLRRAAAPEVAKGQGRVSVLPSASLPLGRLLIVDDDREFLAYVIRLGRAMSLEVLAAPSSKEALETVAVFPPDAAIIDVRLGNEEHGFELARQLRDNPRLVSLPMAFVSLDGSLENRIVAAHAGAMLFLSKPLEAAVFQDAVRQLLSVPQAEQTCVLVVDDDPSFLDLISASLLEEGIRVHTLSDPRDILPMLSRARPDLVLLDLNMPHITGFDVCRMLRSHAQHKHLPIVVITAHTDTAIRIEAFGAGADDYVPKPFLKQELQARVRMRVERARWQRERAEIDVLTGLFRRQPLLERASARLAEAQRKGQPLSLAVLDIDLFKPVNDNFGHLAGDRVLSGLGGLLTRHLRPQDLRCRWGGEEFVVVLPEVDAVTTNGVLMRILREFAVRTFEGDNGERFQSTFSGGVACFPGDGGTFNELFAVADRRMYAAKRAGRRRILSTDRIE
ncbi:MAG: response regulator [Myxococcales bacterium]